MCLIYFAKKINIYYRDLDKFTKADAISTYIFILSMILVLVFYTKQYYIIVKYDLENCEKEYSNNSCLKTEMSYIIVPYIGIIYSFFQAIYKGTDILAFLANCICCYQPVNFEPTSHSVDIGQTTIELSQIK